jgi:uncharacterized protein (DUF58 family)
MHWPWTTPTPAAPSPAATISSHASGATSELKRLSLRTRRLADAEVAGSYRSAFRGQGLIFSDLREYQSGDDVRAIHWRASARSGKVYVKSYQEERYLSIVVALDTSSSLLSGTGAGRRARSIEFALLLSQLAKIHGDALGLCLFQTGVSSFISPSRKRIQQQLVLNALLEARAAQGKTNLAKSLAELLPLLRRRSVLFVVTDALTPTPWERELAQLARRHDVIVTMVEDRFDRELPKVGLIECVDAESGERILLDTSSSYLAQTLARKQTERIEALRALTQRSGAELLQLGENPLQTLLGFLQRRMRRIR